VSVLKNVQHKIRKEKKKLCGEWVLCHGDKLYIEITKPIRQTVALTNTMIKTGLNKISILLPH